MENIGLAIGLLLSVAVCFGIPLIKEYLREQEEEEERLRIANEKASIVREAERMGYYVTPYAVECYYEMMSMRGWRERRDFINKSLHEKTLDIISITKASPIHPAKRSAVVPQKHENQWGYAEKELYKKSSELVEKYQLDEACLAPIKEMLDGAVAQQKKLPSNDIEEMAHMSVFNSMAERLIYQKYAGSGGLGKLSFVGELYLEQLSLLGRTMVRKSYITQKDYDELMQNIVANAQGFY